MSDVLDLDATRPPAPPRVRRLERMSVLATKVPADLWTWTAHRAEVENTTVSMWLRRLIERERAEGLPEDCAGWLTVQAAQCGTPGDPHGALVVVIRHLAARWPNGARLNEAPA